MDTLIELFDLKLKKWQSFIVNVIGLIGAGFFYYVVITQLGNRSVAKWGCGIFYLVIYFIEKGLIRSYKVKKGLPIEYEKDDDE
ncbi:hypothetical protein GNF18_07225 [Ligilactobacillus pobuzihii]|uniref:hypothetical protein n=1 Tax=Ligilactobacillus pobuzihii TaxID=449659 RepID=UPI0019CF96C4|nr:hypothetical protein [Ligilactobacillus pobuzihii]MBN7274926.1 hypothetical protein [Ligilactobacillus pobuzihii]